MTRNDGSRFQTRLGRLLESIDEPIKIYRTALTQAGRHLGASGGAVVIRNPVSDTLKSYPWGAAPVGWDDSTVRAFIALERPDLPPHVLMAPIVVGGRAIGVLVVARAEGTFPDGAGRFLVDIGRKVAHEVELREERRLNRVVDQIKDRTVRDLRPKDLFYQVLHGLRSLTRYDHSSALLIAEDEGARLVLHAEQVAWEKQKSRRIGRKIHVPDELRGLLRRPGAVRVLTFDPPRPRRDGGAATPHPPAGGDGLPALGRLLRWGGRGKEPAEGTLLLAPMHHDNELLGLLKIAAIRPGAFGEPEAEAVSRVLRHVASVIHLSRRALSMEERMIESEKKHAMADLARAISHDVKNAIGAILPLAQQAREELQSGTFDREVLSTDLHQIEQSARVCQRIFDGMLQLARSGVRPQEKATLARVLQGPLGILATRIRRAGVALEVRIPDDLPEINASRGGLDQLFLNLFTNAIDAMPAGGKLRVSARSLGERVEVKVGDTGEGIAAEQLKRIHEPFYTTKEEGFGLGLAICRSILWENGGDMQVDSAPGRGTTVTLTLPAATAAAAPPPRPAAAPRSAAPAKIEAPRKEAPARAPARSRRRRARTRPRTRRVASDEGGRR
ncbi:MAG TPA: ATP-binding protein [Dongiaceae bacterium]|nr:ATP-binding protein [Dongiaceae bacterium]